MIEPMTDCSSLCVYLTVRDKVMIDCSSVFI